MFERFSVGIVAEFDFIDRLGYDQLQRVSAFVCFCVLIFTHCFSDLDLFLQKDCSNDSLLMHRRAPYNASDSIPTVPGLRYCALKFIELQNPYSLIGGGQLSSSRG